ncbi:siphovirus ReqiPepy6 Gp37-like family protein [Micromonospora aurantiaca]|uniref:siphovirus ReqiPepy6 Gp37-like family protein n=1 Tax=Micromonospora aurantiaca (nom. illeg.) TaxID=47850 RepID=UPI0034391F74
MQIRVLVTDRALTQVGPPLAGVRDLDVELRHMTAGAGTFTVPATPVLLEQLAAGNRIVVQRRAGLGRPWDVFGAGPLEAEPGEWEWSANPKDGSAGLGRISVPFSTDEAYVVERVTFPVPGQPATAQVASAVWTGAGNAEAVMRSVVDLNAGPGAIAARRVPGLVLGALAGVGGNVSISTRFQPLGDVLRTLALAGGGLGWRVVQVGTTLEFQVFAPRDLSGTVRFSRGLGNLRKFRWQPKSPTCTVAIVGGQGQGTARTIRERVDAAAVTRWRRVEKFIDQRNTSVLAELDQAGDEALADGAEQLGLDTETIDTPRQAFGVQFGLGDRATVELPTGVVLTDVVTSARLTGDAKRGYRVSSTVGTRPQSADLAWLAEVRRIRRRLQNLEAV